MLARRTVGNDFFARADAVSLVGGNLAAGEDDLERAPGADETRQTHGAAVEERHAPAAAVDAEISRFFHHADVAPKRDFETAGDRRAGNRRDHRLVEFEPCRPQRTARNRFPIIKRVVNFAQRRRIADQRSAILEIPSGAERTSLSPEHRHG